MVREVTNEGVVDGGNMDTQPGSAALCTEPVINTGHSLITLSARVRDWVIFIGALSTF